MYCVPLLQAAGWVGAPPGAADLAQWAAGVQGWVGAWVGAAWAWAAAAWAAAALAAWGAVAWVGPPVGALVLVAPWVAGVLALHLPLHPLCLMRTTTLRR